MNTPTPKETAHSTATREWELVDTTGARRAHGSFEHVYTTFRELANSEFQNKTMTPGFTLRRAPLKNAPRKGRKTHNR